MKKDERTINGKDILFRPPSPFDAARVQQMLFHYGYIWADGDLRATALEKCVERGIVVSGGRFWFPGENHKPDAVLMTPKEFIIAIERGDIVPPAEARTGDAFNALAARVDTLEQKLDRVLSLLEPAEGAKKGLKL